MKKLSKILFLSTGLLILVACTAVKVPVTNEYQISSYSAKQFSTRPHHSSLLVTAPEAAAGYQTEEMLYVKTPFQLEAFAKNAWIDPPADMLFPLLVQSLQRSGFFYAVSSSPYSQGADYRLDTQLLSLEQNFLKKPSVLFFSIKVVLTQVNDNKVIASRIISQQIPCPMDTPYGGVIAANKASLALTSAVTHFVVSSIKND